MNRGTLFLLIILFSQVVFAQSEQFAQYSRQLQQVSCPFRNPALSGLKDLRNISKEQCKELLQSKQCKDLFDKIRANGEKPEEKGLKCNDPQSLVTKLQDDWNYNLGCAIGGWNFVKDTFVVAGIQLGEFAGKVAENNRAIEDASKKDQAENVICDKDPQYKKNLYTLYNSNVPKLLKVTPPTDAIIGQTSCEAIKAQLKKARLEKSKYAGDLLQAKIMARNPNLTADEKEFRDWNTNPQPLKINNVDLIAMAKAKLKEMGIALQCYDARSAAAISCEILAEEASIALTGVGVAVKAAKFAKVAKLAGIAEKGGETGAVAEAATATRAVAAAEELSPNMKLAAEANARIKAGASKEEIRSVVGKIDDTASDAKAARLSVAEATLGRAPSQTAGAAVTDTATATKEPLSESDWIMRAHQKASDKGYRVSGGASEKELSVADLKDKLKDRPDSISPEETRKLVENGVLGSDVKPLKTVKLPEKPPKPVSQWTSNDFRLNGDKLKNEARAVQTDPTAYEKKLAEARKSYQQAANKYEDYLKNLKYEPSERDYSVAARVNADAGDYKKAADYYIKSFKGDREALFQSTQSELSQLRDPTNFQTFCKLITEVTASARLDQNQMSALRSQLSRCK